MRCRLKYLYLQPGGCPECFLTAPNCNQTSDNHRNHLSESIKQLALSMMWSFAGTHNKVCECFVTLIVFHALLFSRLGSTECKSLRPFKTDCLFPLFPFFFLLWTCKRTTSAKQDHYNLNAVYKVPFRLMKFQRASAAFLVSDANLDCLNFFILPIMCQDHRYYHLFLKCVCLFDIYTP